MGEFEVICKSALVATGSVKALYKCSPFTILFWLVLRQSCHTWPWGFPFSTPALCSL